MNGDVNEKSSPFFRCVAVVPVLRGVAGSYRPTPLNSLSVFLLLVVMSLYGRRAGAVCFPFRRVLPSLVPGGNRE